jgi:peptidyl-prolyl cis-trans isomerase B (cyclophilin B)
VATSNKRARELARAKEERRRARAAAAAAKRKRRRIFAAVLAVSLVLATTGGYLIYQVLNSDDEPTASPPDAPTADQADAVQPVASCQAPGEMTDAALSFPAAGDGGLAGASAATFTFQTNCGDIVVAADAAAAPQTVNSMAFLASQGYFDSTLCHRLTTEGIFVLQCGDPTGSGSGSPGYSLPEENLPAEGANNYPAGTVAMANAGPGTTGSQFFIVYEDTSLPPNYTIWGTVTEGLDIVKQVAEAGTTDGGSDGAPSQGVMIGAATVVPQ